MIITLSIISILAVLLIFGKLNSCVQFNKKVKLLFSQSKNISNQKFTYSQLNSLPEPVQLYLKKVLKENQPYISSVRMTHSGQFKTGLNKNWIKIEGEQYANSENPGFIWKGTTSMFVANDMYIKFLNLFIKGTDVSSTIKKL
jgi:hypothetical protein